MLKIWGVTLEEKIMKAQQLNLTLQLATPAKVA